MTPKVPKVVCELIVSEMRNMGQQEDYWSDDEHKWKKSGENYVKVKAMGLSTDNPQIHATLELPESLAKKLRIGQTLVIT